MRTLLAMLCVCSLTTTVVHGGAEEGKQATWHNAVTFETPKESFLKSRVTRSAEWLRRHSVQFVGQKDEDRISVIAWKDPTLEPTDPKHLAGYVITDTLWSAKALEIFDPVVSRELERSVQRLGWYGNGLHDVLFHRLDKILHCPADKDYVHGFSLGRFPAADGRTIDLRVFRRIRGQ